MTEKCFTYIRSMEARENTVFPSTMRRRRGRSHERVIQGHSFKKFMEEKDGASLLSVSLHFKEREMKFLDPFP